MLVVFEYFEWETFEWLQNSTTCMVMIMFATLGFVIEYCWAKAAVNFGPVACVNFYTSQLRSGLMWSWWTSLLSSRLCKLLDAPSFFLL